jgi:hypothetical protein
MFQNPEKEKQIPETVFERAYDLHENVSYGRNVLERSGLLKLAEPEIIIPAIPRDTPLTHTEAAIDLDAYRRAQEARNKIDAEAA